MYFESCYSSINISVADKWREYRRHLRERTPYLWLRLLTPIHFQHKKYQERLSSSVVIYRLQQAPVLERISTAVLCFPRLIREVKYLVSAGKRQPRHKGYFAFLLYNLFMKTTVEEHVRYVIQDQHFLCIFLKPQSPQKILVH